MRSSILEGINENGSRVRAVSVKGVVWYHGCSELCGSGFAWPEDVRRLWFGFMDGSLGEISLPELLKELYLTTTSSTMSNYNAPWPRRLKRLILEGEREKDASNP